MPHSRKGQAGNILRLDGDQAALPEPSLSVAESFHRVRQVFQDIPHRQDVCGRDTRWRQIGEVRVEDRNPLFAGCADRRRGRVHSDGLPSALTRRHYEPPHTAPDIHKHSSEDIVLEARQPPMRQSQGVARSLGWVFLNKVALRV
jgi:hypothetical protein